MDHGNVSLSPEAVEFTLPKKKLSLDRKHNKIKVIPRFLQGTCMCYIHDILTENV